MGITSLRSFLQSLCCNSPWNYAVFWKHKHQGEMILVWEDGYCDNWKLRNLMEGTVDGFDLENSNEILSSAHKSSVPHENPSEYPISLVDSDMSKAYHVFGKGAVGEAACTGNPRWIYSNSMGTDVFCSALVAECPHELLPQILAGIKTILLLPVLPHGVLQLGSMEMVAEDAAIGAYLKSEFETHKKFEACDGESPIQQFSLLSTLMENLEEKMITDVYKINENQKAIMGASSIDQNLSTANQMMPVPVFMVQDLSGLSVKDVPYTLENVIDGKLSSQSLGMVHAAEPQLNYQSHEDNKSTITESNIFNSFCQEENIRSFPYSDAFDVTMCGEYINGIADFYTERCVIVPTISAYDCDNGICESGGNILSFPRDCELHKALGPAVAGNPSQYPYDSSILGHSVPSNSTLDSHLTQRMGFSGIGTHGFPVKQDDIGHLLEDLVVDACGNTDDNSSDDSSSNEFNCASSMKMSSEFLATCKIPSQSKPVALAEEDQVPRSFATSAFMAKRRNPVAYLSPSASSIESTMSVLTHEQQQRKGLGSMNLGKGVSLSSTNKRKVHAGDNRRPRPRDRQLIQDRIKELRELVPNGAKCSIDGLLDRTVKHMLFLRSVSERADKLRQQALKEETDENIPEEPEVNIDHQNGTSWAMELGSEQLYPIVVKDLEHPGHMLIEMLCNDHSRFLEIADVIYRLQLTVLKGVMERRSNNTWACFVVEATRNFHRLDIFWPLMQLLQQNQTASSSKI
ncbi:transcription factor LHW-like isoform X2 [Olea europaea var. sylvestris]|uniref:transcription factor LHW-like isoform X2 n=1 Tax=Olea europaea var. sylvestris TaxID=158386 RepID=UPI000C1D0904|nr:transcription factor LHW-like isoform X2 [Olea europaea var. sylvestris]